MTTPAARKRGSTALAAGSATSGVLAYVVFAVTTQALGAEAAAPVSVMWSYWTFAAAAFTFPLQHWITRSIASHQEGAVNDAMRLILTLALVSSVAVGALAWLKRGDLFGRDDLWFPVLCAAMTLGAAFAGVVRGGLAGRRRFFAVAWSLVGENAVRCAATVGLMLGGVRAPAAYGLSLVGGYLVGLVWPSAVRFSGPRVERPASPLVFLSGAAGGQLLGQAVLTGGPILLALTGGSPAEITALFAALALFRAPYTMALGLMAQLTGKLTVLVTTRQVEALRSLRIVVLCATLVALTAGAGVGAWLGPILLPLIFGKTVALGAVLNSVIAVGSVLAVVNLVATIAVLAQNRAHAVVRAWVLAVVAGGITFIFADLGALERVVATFVAAEVIALFALAAEELRGAGRLARH